MFAETPFSHDERHKDDDNKPQQPESIQEVLKTSLVILLTHSLSLSLGSNKPRKGSQDVGLRKKQEMDDEAHRKAIDEVRLRLATPESLVRVSSLVQEFEKKLR